ncbi:hypothetical protein O3M35_009273 [Rhynocoris fuscipes]|uniref:Protein sleepless n=1 Tax=Rhynocoris fuscipes TaxID=488301 RepID=A0AAW1D7P5_9HEMI
MNAIVINSALLFTFVCLFILPQDAEGIWCFQCNSAYHQDCENIKPNDTKSVHYKECDDPELFGKEIFCRKLIQRVFDREGLVRVVRRCGWVIHTGKDCYTVRSVGHEETSCQCFTDGCNSATSIFNHYTSIILTLCFSLFYLNM